MPETTQITTNPVGRPSKYSEEAVRKLEDIFKIGGTVEEATSNAGITKPTYYEWLEKNPDLLTKMESAQHYADIKAKHLVIKTIVEDENDANAKWWLEKREFKNQSQSQTNVQVNFGDFVKNV